MRSRGFAGLLAVGIFAQPAAAEANCGDFGGLGVALVTAASAGSAISGGIIAPAVIALSDDTRDYPYGRNALFSVGAGGLLTLLYAIVDLSTGCAIANELDAASLIAVPGATLGVSVLTAVLLWAYAEEREELPIAFGLIPHEGGAFASIGSSF